MAEPISYKIATYDGKREELPTNANSDLMQTSWWNLEGEADISNSIAALVEYWRQNQTMRLTQLTIAARIYGNLSPAGITGLSLSRLNAIQPSYRERVTFNAIQSGLDAITSKIAKNRPKPLFLTNGGDYRTQRKAKKLNKFVDGIFHENRAYEMGPIAFRDAGVWGDGLVKVCDEHDRVVWTRTRADELFFDEVEAFNGTPQQMHQVRMVARERLAALFPDKKDIIARAAANTTAEFQGRPHASDLISVCESWHLASAPSGEDGHHCISIAGNLLTDMEPWPHDFFPFARMKWSPRLYGWWSQSGVEQTQQLQIELNRSLQQIAQTLYRGSTYKVFVENGSKVVKEHLNNDIGTIIMYSGTKPEYAIPPLVQPEFFRHVQDTVQRIYEQFGVSMLSAASQKPAGLNSGKALREFNDIESDRFQTLGHQYEDFYMDLGRLSIATASRIAKRKGGKYSVRTPEYADLREVEWKDISLTENEYTIQASPVSSFADDPSGRLQEVQEQAQAGFIRPRTARRLLAFPDVKAVDDLAFAAEEYMERIVEKIVDDGIYTMPRVYNDLAYGRELAVDTYNWGQLNNLESERLDMLQRFIQQIDALMPAPAPMNVVPNAPTGAPQGPPVPPNASDLIQNTPQVPLQ